MLVENHYSEWVLTFFMFYSEFYCLFPPEKWTTVDMKNG